MNLNFLLSFLVPLIALAQEELSPRFLDSNFTIGTYPASGICSGKYAIRADIGSSGIVASDGSSSSRNYTPSTACEWNIVAPKNAQIRIEFEYSITECGWDYVYVLVRVFLIIRMGQQGIQEFCLQ